MAAIITQFFLAFRYDISLKDKKIRSSVTCLHSVYQLTKSIPIVGVIGLLSFLGFFFGVYAAIRSGIINE